MRYSIDTEILQVRWGYVFFWTFRDYGAAIKTKFGWSRTVEGAEKRCDKWAQPYLHHLD